MKNIYKFFCIFILVIFSNQSYASIVDGTIDSTHHNAVVCENDSCTPTSTSGINFGYFTNQSSKNVHVYDTNLRGYIWGSSFGWVVLNCADTTSGCSSTNGNFKVSNNYNGTLSGYAWGDSAGWINFGPFSNSSTSPITINSNGQFAGYAWSQNFGWIKFDCDSGSAYCVETDWRPRSTRPQCSDGIDNNSNGYIDNLDDSCLDSNGSYNPNDNSEENNRVFGSVQPHNSSVDRLEINSSSRLGNTIVPNKSSVVSSSKSFDNIVLSKDNNLNKSTKNDTNLKQKNTNKIHSWYFDFIEYIKLIIRKIYLFLGGIL